VRDYIIIKEKEVIDNDNLDKFYRCVNNKMTRKSVVGALCDNDYNHVVEDKQKANLLNIFLHLLAHWMMEMILPLTEVPDNVWSLSLSPYFKFVAV